MLKILNFCYVFFSVCVCVLILCVLNIGNSIKKILNENIKLNNTAIIINEGLFDDLIKFINSYKGKPINIIIVDKNASRKGQFIFKNKYKFGWVNFGKHNNSRMYFINEDNIESAREMSADIIYAPNTNILDEIFLLSRFPNNTTYVY